MEFVAQRNVEWLLQMVDWLCHFGASSKVALFPGLIDTAIHC
jgi:hypothetical protein